MSCVGRFLFPGFFASLKEVGFGRGRCCAGLCFVLFFFFGGEGGQIALKLLSVGRYAERWQEAEGR